MKRMLPVVLGLAGLLAGCDGSGTPDPLGVRETIQDAELERICIGLCIVRNTGGSLATYSAEVVSRCGKIRPCRAGPNRPGD